MIGLGNPGRGWIAFLFLSGKALRALSPLLLLASIAGSALLIASLFGLKAMLGTLLSGLLITAMLKLVHPNFFSLIAYFLAGNVAAAIGSILFLSGQHAKLWKLSTTKT